MKGYAYRLVGICGRCSVRHDTGVTCGPGAASWWKNGKRRSAVERRASKDRCGAFDRCSWKLTWVWLCEPAAAKEPTP